MSLSVAWVLLAFPAFAVEKGLPAVPVLPQAVSGAAPIGAVGPASVQAAEGSLDHLPWVPAGTFSAVGATAQAVSQPGADVPSALSHTFDNSLGHVCAACAPQEGDVNGATAVTMLDENGRLPEGVSPKSYALSLKLEPAQSSFQGQVRIVAQATKATKVLILHQLDLTIGAVRVNGKRVNAVVHNEGETMALHLDASVQGEVIIEIAYEGKMNELMRGLFKANGRNGGKEEAWAFTHLEPTHARRVLPSFDEPIHKATFKLTLDVPEGLTPLSNTAKLKERVENGRRIAEFAETPTMSSYLLSVYAARLVSKSRMVGNTLVSVWAAPDQIDQADYALDVAENALKELSAYFGMPYQLPKLDLVTAPDFASGAMENWGAVLFRDSSLLIDSQHASEAARRRVADVVTHEIAHQWFGNLVTMKDWPDLWLNEAFATWLSAKIVDKWQPQWKMWEDFGHAKRGPLGVDALPGTRPIRSLAKTPAEIQALFDGITYNKGGAILRMIEDWIGEVAFRDGVRTYLKRYAHGNAEAADLWAELEQASGKPISKLGDGWINQAGVPLISASVSSDGRSLTLEQTRLSALKTLGEERWIIPITIRYRLQGEAQARTERVVLDQDRLTVKLPGQGRLLWAYPNAGDVGYFRLGLKGALLDAVVDARAELTADERSALLNHLWASVKTGKLSAADFSKLLAKFKADTSYALLGDSAGYLKALGQDLAGDEEQRRTFGRVSEEFLLPHAQRLGWTPKKGESDDDAMARPVVLAALAALSPDAPVLSAVDGLVASYLKDAVSVPASVAPVALAVAAARRNDPVLFTELEARLTAPTAEQRDQALRALGEFTEPALVDRYLAMTLGPKIRPQDAWKPFQWLLSNPATRQRSWLFVQNNWAALLAKLGPRGATRIIGSVAGLATAQARREVEAFFTNPANDVEMARKTLAQSLSSIELSLAFQAAQKNSFAGWMSAEALRLLPARP